MGREQDEEDRLRQEELLDEALEESFPASDPISPAVGPGEPRRASIESPRPVSSAPSSEVRDNPEQSRYELPLPGGVAFATYRRSGDTLIIPYSEVPAALQGQGIGSRLIRGMLDDVRMRGLKVVPHCGFVAAYFARHPEEKDLLAPG